MRNVSYFLSCLAAALFLGGCGPSGEWKERLAAANAISFAPSQNLAYQAMAIDAAMANRPDVVKICLKRMTFQPAQVQTASKSAIILLDLGNHKAALDVAALIDFEPSRNQVLEKIATNRGGVTVAARRGTFQAED